MYRIPLEKYLKTDQEIIRLSLFMALFVGTLIGWLAAFITQHEDAIVLSVIAGIIGAVVGGAFFALGSRGNEAGMLFSWASLWWSVAGAIVSSFFVNLVSEHPERP